MSISLARIAEEEAATEQAVDAMTCLSRVLDSFTETMKHVFPRFALDELRDALRKTLVEYEQSVGLFQQQQSVWSREQTREEVKDAVIAKKSRNEPPMWAYTPQQMTRRAHKHGRNTGR